VAAHYMATLKSFYADRPCCVKTKCLSWYTTTNHRKR